MFTQFTINDTVHVLALNSPSIDQSKVVRYLNTGRVVELSDAADFGNAQPVDLSTVAAKLNKLAAEVNSRFVASEELVNAFIIALAANENAFVISPPGTAKTGIINAFGQGIDGTAWDILMNADTVKEEIFGMIDPVAFKDGEWRRNWDGIATCHVALLDEFWKSSGQNANLFLRALNEKEAKEGKSKISIPLISGLAASNEAPEDKERQAIFDRFLVRLSIDYIRDTQDFLKMLTADAGSTPMPKLVKPEELYLMGAAAELMALFLSDDVKQVIAELFREIQTNGHSVSNRRWRKTLKLAAANALLMGQPFAAHHLQVARWTLWADMDAEQDIRNLVLSKTDPIVGDILDAEALLADLNSAVTGMSSMSVTDQAATFGKAKKLLTKVSDLQKVNGTSQHASRLTSLKAAIETAKEQVENVLGMN